MIKTEEKIRRMYNFINANKNKQGDPEPPLMPMKEQISELESDIDLMQKENELDIDEVKDKIFRVRVKVKDAEREVNMLKIKLREKDHEVKLNEMKAKEIQRSIPHRRLKPLQASTSQDFRTTTTGKLNSTRSSRLILSSNS